MKLTSDEALTKPAVTADHFYLFSKQQAPPASV